jgi:glycyl-tRNA synthetase
VETSIGVDRMFLLTMCNAYREEKVGENDTRIVLALPPVLAPVKAAILPLTKKEGLPELARKLYDVLKLEFNCVIEEKDSIGRRYRRQDANGTPFCITIDNETVNDNCVTIRHRDTMVQERVAMDAVRDLIDKAVSIRNSLAKF